MIDWSWIASTSTAVLMVALSAVGIYLALLILTRMAGLRSFSKMSSFDFALTVAFGSVIASTVLTRDPPLLTGVAALVALYGIQYVVSTTRRYSKFVEHAVDNEPLLVMAREEILSDNLDEARMTIEDLKSKLRMAGITHPKEVLAVVIETTGDVAVLRRSDEVDEWLFEGVRGAERLPAGARPSAA